MLWIHLAWPSSRNLSTSESICKCRDIVHIFTCRARDTVTFTCTSARKVGHLGKMFSHLTFVSLSFFFSAKRGFDESFRFILNRSISVFFIKPFTFTCPLAPRWRIGPPHVLSIYTCRALQCAPLSTLLWTSPFLLCAARLFLGSISGL